MTNLDMYSLSPMDLLWTAPTVARRGRKAKPLTKVQLRIESVVMGLLVEADGITMERICAITGYTAAQCRPVLQRLIASGDVKRTGNTRGTRYQAVAL